MKNRVIPCKSNPELKEKIDRFAEVLKEQAHTLGDHGLSEKDFYESGLFRGAIERVRGQFSAKMGRKRDFVQRILNDLEDNGAIKSWDPAGSQNRHDYIVELNSGKMAAIELKGCLDGNNTNIWERPPHAEEFILWSVCSNPSADPRRNAWSGIHTRLSAEIISRQQQMDGLIVWDWFCGKLARRCPKLVGREPNIVGPYELPPPCIYLFPATIPSPRNNPRPKAQRIEQVEILNVFHRAYGGAPEHLHFVEMEVRHEGRETVRVTSISRNDDVVAQSRPSAIQRA